MINQKIAQVLLDINAVQLNPSEPFEFSSGALSPIYCDNRVVMSHPAEREELIDAFLAVISESSLHFDVIAGTATAGIAHAAWLADRLKKPMVYVRSSAKKHGKQNQIEGRIDPGQHVLVIEDLVSTGGSVLTAAQALRDVGARVTDVLAIFNYGFNHVDEYFAEKQIQLHTLTGLEALLSVAMQQGSITAEQKLMIEQWRQDPLVWRAS